MSNDPSPSMFSAADRIAGCSGDIVTLLARLGIGYVFLMAGYGKLTNMAGTVAYLNALKVPSPDLWYWPAMITELAVGIALILGVATRYFSLICVVFVVIATALAHRYWEYPAAQQMAQFNNFTKNLAIIGGALLLFWVGGGRFSVDNALRNR